MQLAGKGETMIVVFGSINADLFTHVATLPRPGETVQAPDYVLRPGGKGANQAVAAARAGAVVHMIGMVGEDVFAEPVLRALTDAKVDVAAVGHSGVTGTAMVCVEDSGENLIVVASGANQTVTADQVPDALLGPEATLVLQMELLRGPSEAVIARARANGCRIVLNLAPALPISPEALSAVDVLILNELEAESLGAETGAPMDRARLIAERHNICCIITLGAAGAVMVAEGEAWTVAAVEIQPIDTVGAGDGFVGALAAALNSGADLPSALHRASIAGALCCLKEGAQDGLPTAGEIDAALSRLAPPRRSE
jgi:ribokinase